MKFLMFSFVTLVCASLPVSLKASLPALATPEQQLLTQVNVLLNTPSATEGDIVRFATLLATPEQILSVCPKPELSISGNNSRLTGKRTVVALCGKRKYFLPVRISARGTWWTARQNLPGGTVITSEDIQPVSGQIDNQPPGIIFSAAQITGQRLTRNIEQGQPVLHQQLRNQWRLKSGQTVELITNGPGFTIRSQGKALHNAPVNGMLKVQLRNGQTVSGKVLAEGRVMIFLQE